MNQRVTVPIRVRPKTVSGVKTSEIGNAMSPEIAEAVSPVTEMAVAPPPGPRLAVPMADETEDQESELEEWRDRALRLQAEMENFRKRQQRLADERVTADRERLLRAFLDVTDDLKRALSVDGAQVENLREGVELTYQNMLRLLEREGAEPVAAEGQPFDPTWHEAVSTVPHHRADAPPDVVVQEVQTGYRLGERLLRPARVVVAI